VAQELVLLVVGVALEHLDRLEAYRQTQVAMVVREQPPL
jgi:hypothetical protein